jgi:hypothetical protein
MKIYNLKFMSVLSWNYVSPCLRESQGGLTQYLEARECVNLHIKFYEPSLEMRYSPYSQSTLWCLDTDVILHFPL